MRSHAFHPLWLLEPPPTKDVGEQTWCWDWGDDCEENAKNGEYDPRVPSPSPVYSPLK